MHHCWDNKAWHSEIAITDGFSGQPSRTGLRICQIVNYFANLKTLLFGHNNGNVATDGNAFSISWRYDVS